MSLRSLRDLRRRGAKPLAVRVVIGVKPKWFPDDPGTVFIAPSEDLNLLDMRPLVGLKFTSMALAAEDDEFLLAATTAAIEAGALFVGAMCGSGDAFGICKAHLPLWRSSQEVLCQ